MSEQAVKQHRQKMRELKNKEKRRYEARRNSLPRLKKAKRELGSRLWGWGES